MVPGFDSAIRTRTKDLHPPLPQTLSDQDGLSKFLASLESKPAQPSDKEGDLVDQIEIALDEAARSGNAGDLDGILPIIEQSPGLRSRAGIPLAPIVAYSRLRCGVREGAEELALWMGAHWPCEISEPLIEKAIGLTSEMGLEDVVTVFQELSSKASLNRTRLALLHQITSGLEEASGKVYPVNGQQWLAFEDSGDETRGAFRLVTIDQIREAIAQDAAMLQANLGPGLSLRTKIQRIPLSEVDDSSTTLASARSGAVELQVVISDADQFYARLDRRTNFVAGFVGLALLTGLMGWLTTRATLLKQRRISELKSNFVASVSHELRAPAASVLLMAERLDEGRVESKDQQRDYFRFIREETQRLGSLIENVLDFARIEQGRKTYVFEESDLASLVEECVRTMSPVAAERDITLKTRIADLPAIPNLDAGEIRQALLNLIDNAIKYSPEKSLVEVGLSPEGGKSHRFRLWVKDEGPGVPHAERKRIFERFYRSGSEMRRTTKGVGIGLSLVRHIAEGHQGRVRLDSGVGSGACFILELPYAPAATDHDS